MRGGLPALAVVVLLAGCSSPPSPDLPDAATPGPGAIAGVVVDEAVRPIKGALVEVVDTGQSTETGENGAFLIADVPAGSHVVRASHGLYDTVQQAVDVVEGADEGAKAKFQLTRVIFATPYVQTQKFDGFLVCSIGFSIYASEECGQGVGVPCEVPMLGCQRVGGQGNNYAQWDFYLDGPFVKTLVVEMVWTPTSSTLSEFQLNVGNDWTCDPTCNGNPLNVTGGPSPLYATVDFPRNLTLKDGAPIALDANTRFSTFIWPNWGCANFSVPSTPECAQQLNVAVNQPFQQFATAFYYLPAPQGWSLVAGDPSPF